MHAAIAAVFLLAGQPLASIVVDDHYQIGEPIVITAGTEADLYLWNLSEGAQYRALDNKHTLHVWAVPGTYTVTQTAVRFNVDWDARTIEPAAEQTAAQFTVGDLPPPDPVNPYAVPSQALRETVGPITRIQMSPQGATALAAMYHEIGHAVLTDTVGTTAELRRRLIERGKSLGLQGRYAGLADAVDDALEQLLGLAIRELHSDDAAKLDAVAWAIWEAGH